MDFNETIIRSRKPNQEVYSKRLLSLDPGHTTGFAIFHGTTLVKADQIDTKPEEQQPLEITLTNLMDLFTIYSPEEVVFEDYRIYAWRAKHHANSEVHTVRLIGMIMTLCLQHGLQSFKQSASIAKSFATNAKLEEWGLYQPGYKHANDAIRHGCYFIAFGPKIFKSPGKTRKVG